MSIKDASVHGVDRTIQYMGNLVDAASDQASIDGLSHAVGVLDGMAGVQLSDEQKARLHYFRGNAFSAKRNLERSGKPAAWDWRQEEFEQEIISLRTASQAAVKADIPPEMRCPMITNLGNALSYVGRFVEAIDWWDRALVLDAHFGMAIGNKGYGLFHYGQQLYDDGHRALFYKKARDLMVAGVKHGCDPGARAAFERLIAYIDRVLPPEFAEHPFETETFPMGKTDGEKRYRSWCLKNRLFLNPLNDLGPFSIAAQDVFTVPSIVTPISEGPRFHGFFNQMKQEFVSARFLFYEGASATRPHFSDRDVLLFDTLDYPCYALAVEKQKVAFRSAYSLLDKIAFFTNAYMGLGIPEKRIYFKSLWYDNQDRNRGLRSEFASLDNWPLRGLFWLAKDLHDDSPGYRAVLEPAAQRLAEIRNHVEHKYLKVHDEMWAGPQSQVARMPGLADTLAYSVFREEMAEGGMLMLKLARAALIYLSLGIHTEERRRARNRPAGQRIGSMPIMTWPDKWKQ
jgi:tetratricopeptide (TPR) repeat protein